MNRLVATVLDWIYPPVCVGCGLIIPVNKVQEKEMGMCLHCQELFEPIEPYTCKVCGVPTKIEVDRCVSCLGKSFEFDKNTATFLYDELIRDLLLKLKFTRKKQIAHSLGQLWAAHVKDIPKDVSLVPLPMHAKKKRERGFNQAEVLAKALGKKFGVSVVNAVERVVDTPPQSGLHPRQRVDNIKGAFAVVKAENAKGKNYIVVDDIYTTGASLNECARVLKDAGAKSVCGLTLTVVKRKEKKNG